MHRCRGFRSERTEAEAKLIERRPAGLRQFLPVAVNYSEDGGSRFSRTAGLEDQRQRALQVRVLNGNSRDVAVMHSSGAMPLLSTQPVPVGVAMTNMEREKAPIRITSASAS